MNKIKKYWIVLFFVLFGVIVFLPPVIHGNELLVINNDTAAHIEAIEDGSDSFYAGRTWIGRFKCNTEFS
jgi:hypothetical protein